MYPTEEEIGGALEAAAKHGKIAEFQFGPVRIVYRPEAPAPEKAKPEEPPARPDALHLVGNLPTFPEPDRVQFPGDDAPRESVGWATENPAKE
jgi:hypothetical protein